MPDPTIQSTLGGAGSKPCNRVEETVELLLNTGRGLPIQGRFQQLSSNAKYKLNLQRVKPSPIRKLDFVANYKEPIINI